MFEVLIFLIIFISLPYLIIWFRNFIWDLYLWQVKEYRIDRVISHYLYDNAKGVRSNVSTYFKIACFTVIFISFLVGAVDILLFLIALMFFLYWYESFLFLPKLITLKVLRPSIKSPRNVLIIFGVIFILLIPYLVFFNSLPGIYSNTDNIVNESISIDNLINSLTPLYKGDNVVYRIEYLIIFFITMLGIFNELVISFYTFIFVQLTRPLAYFKRVKIVKMASEKILKSKKLKVIAITGSYGKSSTKEILYQLLAQKFETIKTDKNNNTDVGVAKTILRELNRNTEVLIAEMGAYKVGEIVDICKIVKPDISVVTGIDKQHLSLYGSMDAIMDSSFEIVECSKPNSTIIFNADNKYCLDLAKKTKFKKKYFSNSLSVENNLYKGNKDLIDEDDLILVDSVKETKRGLDLKLKYNSSYYLLKTNFKALYNVSNLLSAILVCLELGVNIDEIVKIINETNFVVPYLNTANSYLGVKIIDDGYNANFTGFVSALKHLNELKTKGNKHIFTQGIIELGKDRMDIYAKLARIIKENSDSLYTTDKDLFLIIKEKFKDYNAVYLNSVFDFPLYHKTFKQNDILLLEGPFPRVVLNKIYNG